MKIEELRFKNLNSLVGEWTIDFSHPAYDAAGIFAITGPTGSGKTTLLDAICLALYGQTPRLDTVTKSSNDIMSRQTGECFAEVTFATQSGKYRVIWSQHRARKSPQGDLQTPQRELADAVSGVILESSLRKVSEKIIELTGMDFDRFTRAVVLAQGGFAAFLQASPDERAPLLEQITGTEIYSQISIAVHERRSQEREKLAVLESSVSGISVMDAETLAAVTETHHRHRETVVSQQKELLRLQTAIRWYDNDATLVSELSAAKAGLTAFLETWALATSERTVFERATRAARISGDYASLLAQREQHRVALDSLAQLNQDLPTLQEQATIAQRALDDAHQSVCHAKERVVTTKPIVDGMRQLDSQIQVLQKSMAEQTTRLQTIEKEQTDNQRKKTDIDARITQAKTELAASEAYLKDHGDDATLAASWSVLLGYAKRMATVSTDCDQAALARDAIAVDLQSATTTLEKQEKTLAVATVAWTTATETLMSQEKSLAAILEGHDDTYWRAALDQKRDALRQLQHVIETDHKRQVLQASLKTTQRELAETSTQLDNEARLYEASSREVALLEETQRLRAQVEDLEALRAHLVSGEACPLCGAAEHPYVTDGTPTPVSAALQVAKEKQETLRKHCELLRVKSAKSLAEQQHLETALVALVGGGSLPWAEWSAPDRALAEKNMIDEIALLEKRLQAIVDTTKGVNRAKEMALAAKEAVVVAEKTVAAGRHQQALLQHSYQEKQVTIQRLRDDFQSEWEAFCLGLPEGESVSIIGRYSFAEDRFLEQRRELVSTTLPALFETLQGRRVAFESKQKLYLTAEKVIMAESAALAAHDQLMAHIATTIESLQLGLRDEGLQLSTLQSDRQRQYGDRRPDQLESETADGLRVAETTYDRFRVACDVAKTRYQASHARHTELLAASLRYGEAVQRLASLCESGWLALGFRDEADYVAAKLLAEDYAVLQKKLAALDTEKTVLETRVADKEAQYTKHLAQRETDLSLPVLCTSRDDLQRQIEALQHDLGALSQRLADHEKHAAQLAAQLVFIERQKETVDRWAMLHDVIGSADGKKYRNFAQGLTFERMVQMANHHLHRMTDRYTLMRDSSQPLSLNVVDHYQGDGVRVTRNLSGGESFLVSLALALGLSQMSSRNVRLDSLFLDEGFGTLDEEVLETALSNLSALHHEGKRIGVISHVQALKDRIGTKIMVLPESGGRSCLEGPGVSRS
jgi:DNA repair protein SbcC/Rad50